MLGFNRREFLQLGGVLLGTFALTRSTRALAPTSNTFLPVAFNGTRPIRTSHEGFAFDLVSAAFDNVQWFFTS